MCGSQRSEISPRNRVHHLSIELLAALLNQRRVALQDLEQKHHLRLQDVVSELVENELFVPLARVVSLDSHVEELGSERHEEIDIFLGELGLSILYSDLRTRFTVSDSWQLRVCLCQVLASVHIHDVHSNEWVKHVRV